MKSKKMLFKIFLVMTFTMTLVFASTYASANDLTPNELLGKNLFFEKIADPDWVSCATCHGPEVGFTGPIGGINKRGAVYRGAVPQRFGNRKPPSAAYATLSPILHFVMDGDEALFIGGNFWNGRATGERLGNPAADQALAPFLNPVEMNNASKQAVCEQVAKSKKLSALFEAVWGLNSLDCYFDVDGTYDRIGLSIAAYEASSEVNQFSSKYDAFLAGQAELTEEEAWGLELFERPDKGNCAACHPTGVESAFTDFTYDNLGVPRNPDNPFYDMDEVYLDNGTPINPIGIDWVDLGLGGFLQTRLDYEEYAADNYGKQKVPTLRNVDKREYPDFPKDYGHNGYFKSLKSIVHFYNTRDVKDTCDDGYNEPYDERFFTSEKDALKMDCWPLPEIEENVNHDELGNLGLTDAEEDAIVAFLKTLSDGYQP
jgi:cytochrome c peroxidase